MRKIAFTLVALLGLAFLAGCAVSNEEKAACESNGGTVKSERFVYASEGFFGERKTGRLNYCEIDGDIFTVYNEEIIDPDGNFFGPSEENREVFDECSKLEGRTYRTSYSTGKTSTAVRWVCVQGGEYVQIHP